MSDVRVVELAAAQFNRFSRAQAAACGVSERVIDRRLRTGRWVAVHKAVLAIAPSLDDDRSRWMAATLTAPGSVLSHTSALAAWGLWSRPRAFEVVTRPGSGGPARLDGVLVHRSLRLDGDRTTVHDVIPVTTAARTLLDMAPHLSSRALARALREALRLQITSAGRLVDLLARHAGRRGAGRLRRLLQRYSGLPLARARSGAEVAALEVLRDAVRPLPELNVRIGGEEADLVWRDLRLIIEIDGAPWHLDRGEDERKESCWRAAGYEVRRLPADAVESQPERLLALAPPPNVAEAPR